MRKPDRNPLDSACPMLFGRHPPHSKLGIALRKGDARLRLREMDGAESSVRDRERQIADIDDRFRRMIAENQLNVQYLIEFGVSAAEREEFRRILEQVAQNGDLSLRESARIARVRHASKEDVAS